MEKWPVTPDSIREQVNEKAQELHYEITPDAEEILNEVLKDLPTDVSPTKFAFWCKGVVERAIQKRPALKDKAEHVRNEVGKELRYVYKKDRFDALREKIISEDVQEVTPAWFEKNDRSFQRFISTFFKKADSDEVDWDFVAKKMGIEDRFVKRELKKDLSFEERVTEVEHVLKKESPDLFGPRWLFRNCISEYRYFQNVLPREGAIIAWDNFLEALPEEWRKKWSYKESKSGLTFDERVSDLVAVLQEKKPRTFSPKWIEHFAFSDYRYFNLNLSSENGKVAWQDLVGKLPAEWQEKWTYREERDLSGDLCIKELVTLVDDFRVESFSPRWIYDHDPSLYEALKRRFGKTKEGYIAWEKADELLPTEIAAKFSFERDSSAGFSFLAEKIKSRMNPGDKISPTYIRKNMYDVYKFLARNVRDAEGNISWNFILRTLNVDYGIALDEETKVRKGKITLKDIVERINGVCKGNDLKDISVDTLKNYNSTIYNDVHRYVKKPNGAGNWDLIFKEVDEPYKTLWFEREEKRKREVQESTVKDLVEVLNVNDIAVLSPEWIRNHANSIYERIRMHFENKEGDTDWKEFRKLLPLRLKKIWKMPKSKLDEVQPYHDQDEVDELLGRYKDTMYSLFFDKGDELQMAQEIWEALIALAQKGNMEAHQTAFNLAEKIIEEFVASKNESEKGNALYSEVEEAEKEKIINRCIKLYVKKGLFRNYLITSIKFNIKKRGFVDSMDEVNDDERNLHGRLTEDDVR